MRARPKFVRRILVIFMLLDFSHHVHRRESIYFALLLAILFYFFIFSLRLMLLAQGPHVDPFGMAPARAMSN